ncbi:MAG: terpene cyclase/mutase family protein [Planctomycetales bacterium]|nr:terpene cyclase/mutase family protein [Planctomycetales bacterium]
MLKNRGKIALMAVAFNLALQVIAPVTAVSQDTSSREVLVRKAIDFLRIRGQQPDGAVSPKVGVGVTALAATALIQNDVPLQDPMVAKAVMLVAGSAREDGGIYAPDSRIRMYETCVAMLCLQAANHDGRYDGLLARAAKYIKGEQFTESKGLDPSDADYGGAGYGGASRPDLSNTTFFVDALSHMKQGDHDEAIEKALAFVSRCQNLESAHNTGKHAAKINDGGFYYTVSEGGVSAAGDTPDGGLRSYGSMTYAGLKSMIYAGLTPDDSRVTAALTWVQKHYTLDSNPGLGDAGLFYYYHLFAKSLDAAGLAEITDANGVQHDWRAELVEHLAMLQAADGSWTNKNSRWMEGDPNLATVFSLLALSYCK